MKKNSNMKIAVTRKALVLLAAFAILTGCDSYLEENPDNRVELNTVKKAAQLLTNAYSANGYNFTEWMSDNVSYTLGTTKLQQHDEAFEWKDFTIITEDTPAGYWNSSYAAIAHANEVLAVVDELPGTKAEKDAVKAEAYLCRAYAHFMLVNLFGKHYDPETAATDLGVPYVDEPETQFVKKYTRLSVEEVYDRVEEDLLEGLDNVDAGYYANSGKYHWTRNAALAFASRYYLFKGDYDKCIEYSTEMLGSTPDIFVKNLPGLLEQRADTDDYMRLYASPTDDSNLLLMRSSSIVQRPDLGHFPSRSQYDFYFNYNPFNAADFRRDPAWVAGLTGLAASKFQLLFQRSSLTSNVGEAYTIFIAFRGEEVLLNRAECYAIQNRLTEALADLQVMVPFRYDGAANISLALLRSYYGLNNTATNNRIAVLQHILDERQREFMHEGMRWFDIRRYGFEVQHELPTGQVITLESDDLRKVLQIPQAALDIAGLESNPR